MLGAQTPALRTWAEDMWCLSSHSLACKGALTYT